MSPAAALQERSTFAAERAAELVSATLRTYGPVARRYMSAARVPETLQPQEFGLWAIERVQRNPSGRFNFIGLDWGSYTLLTRWTQETLHQPRGEIVMEDSVSELSQHLQIWTRARGRVLVTGLGLGCVVRGLLANPSVEHIDVVELDAGILRVVGPEFVYDPRVTLHHGDALTYQFPEHTTWDVAWHDVWEEGDEKANGTLKLAKTHTRLFFRYRALGVPLQGMWKYPRRARDWIIGRDGRLL